MTEDELVRAAMKVLSARRKVKRGGRKRLEGVERCACGEMPLRRAKARAHKCVSPSVQESCEEVKISVD